MLIDWFTVSAQALNFIILVWLLKRVLYKPIMAAIDARESSVSAQLADAAAQNAKALREVAEFKAKNEDIDRQRAKLLEDATTSAANEGKRMLDEARTAAEAWRAQRQITLRTDAASLNRGLARQVQQQVFAIARRTLADLASVSLEEQSTALFCRRLRAMAGAPKAQLGLALTTSADPARIQSAFDLPAEQQTAIQTALNETFSAAIAVHYETNPEVIAGIELTVNGLRVTWSIAAYLSDLEHAVQEVISPTPLKAA